MKIAARLVCALLMAVLFVAIAFALIAGFFFLMEMVSGHRLVPRGAGWGFAIIAAFVGGLRTGYRLPDNADLLVIIWEALIESKVGRAVLVSVTAWAGAWTIYSWLYLKEGRRCYYDCHWDSETWATFFGVLVGAPISVVVVYLILKWIKAGK